MKIGFDAKRIFHNPTGLGSYARTSIESILEFYPNTEIFLFCPDFPKQKNNHFLKGNVYWDLSKFHKSNEHEFQFEHSEFRQLKLIVSGYKNRILQNWWRRTGMVKRMIDLKLNVYHGLTNEIPTNIPKGIIKVVTLHDVIFIKYPDQYKWFDRFIYFQKTKQAVIQADLVFYTSKATQNDVHDYFNREIKSRISQPVEMIHYQPIKKVFSQLTWQPQNEFPYFIYHSTFNSRKNHILLIKAFGQYLKLHGSSHVVNQLVLVGNGSAKDVQLVENEITVNNLNKHIKLVVGTTDNQLVDFLIKSAGFIYPSLFEGFGIPLFEAASCGLPMALSDIEVFQEFKEYVYDVHFFDPYSLESISNAFLALNNKFGVSVESNSLFHFTKKDQISNPTKVNDYSVLLSLIDRKLYSKKLMDSYHLVVNQ